MKIPWKTDHFFEAKQEVPLRSFGVFVTARRAKWPEDVHGCIGYWNAELREESREALLDKACEVGYKAFWEDERKDAFPTSILKEPESVCEIDFLMLPVIPVDFSTGLLGTSEKRFQNKTYGLLVESPDGKKATYLPGVFSNSSWTSIRSSLFEKAGTAVGRLYAYKIQQIKVPIGLFCESKAVSLCLQDTFKRLLFQHAKKTYPFFPIHVTEEGFIHDPEEEVRNAGLLFDLVQGFQDGVQFSKAQERFLTEAIGAFSRKPISDQAKAFLLPCLTAMGYRTEYLCRDLVSKLRSMDREFQFGETVVGIAKGGCKYLLVPYRSYLLESYPLSSPKDIFQLNWDCQALVVMGKKPFPKPVLDSILTVLEATSINEKTFTNVLAVAWEMIQTVYPHCSLYYKKALDAYRLPICWLLQQRTDPDLPSVYFMLQGGARLDITSHVLGGWRA